MVNPHARIILEVEEGGKTVRLAGRAGRPAAAHQAVRLDAGHDQEGDEADDDRPAAEERRALSQPDRARQHRRRPTPRRRSTAPRTSARRRPPGPRARWRSDADIETAAWPPPWRASARSCGGLGRRARSPAPPAHRRSRRRAYLKASNTEASDHFGCGGVIQGHTGQGVAISADGTTMAVGAPHEGGGAAGVNGNQRDNSVFDAGAVYVFTRAGDGWAQQAYVKASNPQQQRASSATPWRSAPTATRWPCRPSGSRATPRASTAIRRTSRSRRPAPSTCSRAAAPPGRSRPTSRRRTPARPARPTPSAKAISSASRWR